MKVYLKFNFPVLCEKLLEEKLSNSSKKFRISSFGEIEFLETVTTEELKAVMDDLANYGIIQIESQKVVLVQKIKDTIVEMVWSEKDINIKASAYLADQLHHSYGYLSNLFSEVTFTSIENFIILQKIEYAKQLIIHDRLSLTEIADRLAYSSVAHLSTQFKNTTGITPSMFQKIIGKRRDLTNKK